MALSKADFNNINITPAASKKLKWNSAADGFEAGDLGGSMVLLSTQTASSSSAISFTSGIDDTYDEYVFKFINIHPATDGVDFEFQADTGTNTNYNQTITSTFFKSLHDESGGTTALSYDTSSDLAQSTSFQHLSRNVGNDNDQSIAGTLQVFSPSSSTFVKHFISRTNVYTNDDYSIDSAIAGYFNTTTAITRFQFKMASGNMDSGTIKMYGIK